MNDMSLVKELSAAIKEIERKRVAGEVKPVPAGNARSFLLIKAVSEMASTMNVTLKPMHAITTFGELEIASVNGVVFSKEFCDALNTYCKPRCGIYPTAVMEPVHSNWCRINHFDAEKMIHAVAAEH
jgi:hypothetical protein